MTIPKGRIAIRGIGRPTYQNRMRRASNVAATRHAVIFNARTSQGSMLAFNALSLPRQGL
jgi:hypothetical protein